MGYRKYIAVIWLTACSIAAKAQVEPYHAADSATYALYRAGSWKQLATEGQALLDKGVDFPYLRLRVAYALYMQQDYSGAIQQYEAILKADSYNSTARYYLYLCHKYLNHDLYAAYQSQYVDPGVLKRSAVALNSIGLESSFKVAENNLRGNASYTRAGIGLIAGQRLQIDQSVAYFKQYIYSREDVKRVGDPDAQTEYFIRLNYALNSRWSAVGSYHYLYTDYREGSYNSNMVLAGINYTGGYFDLQADAVVAHIVRDRIKQYNASLTVYPNGNLNLYTISRASYHDEADAGGAIFSQIVGYKVINRLWLESAATFGNLDDYIDADGLYIYNAFDNTKLKLGQSGYFQLNNHALLQINYTYEKKLDAAQGTHYNQHSITAGVLWKF